MTETVYERTCPCKAASVVIEGGQARFFQVGVTMDGGFCVKGSGTEAPTLDLRCAGCGAPLVDVSKLRSP